MNWIQGCPSWQKVAAHMRKHPQRQTHPRLGDGRGLGVIRICSSEDPSGEELLVLDPGFAGQWICVIPDSLDVPSKTRLVHLRADRQCVFAAIGIANDWLRLRNTDWGRFSKFLPVTAEGLPVDYKP